MIENNMNNKIDGEVIGIDRCGNTKRINLLERNLNHAEATKEVARELFVKIESSIGPTKAGRNAANRGVTILQITDDLACIYLPDNLEEDQKKALEEILKEKSKYSFYMSHLEEIYNDIDMDTVLKIISENKNKVL